MRSATLMLCSTLGSAVLAAPDLVAQSATLVGTPRYLDVQIGGIQTLDLDLGTWLAGGSYLMLGSLSGRSPGFVVGMTWVPLNPDSWTQLTLTAGPPILQGFRGTLDAQGRARASIVLPPGLPPALAGLEFHHAALALQNGGPVRSSAPAVLRLRGAAPAAPSLAHRTVIDGVANYYSPISEIGEPEFDWDERGRDVKAATGIDIGCLTVRTEASVQREVMSMRHSYTGCIPILDRSDLDQALTQRRYGSLFYAQTHFPLLGNVQSLHQHHAAGLRIMQLQYSSGDVNQGPLEKLGGASDQTGGLTTLGKAVVHEMHKIGMLVDVSHCNAQTQMEAAAIGVLNGKPVVALHTCCRDIYIPGQGMLALYQRNITDSAMRAIAQSGGVVGIMAYAPYLKRPGGGDMDDFITHLEHAIKIAGIDHTSVATDGYLSGEMARAQVADGLLDSPTRWEIVAQRMSARGHSATDIDKVLGANLERVLRAVLR